MLYGHRQVASPLRTKTAVRFCRPLYIIKLPTPQEVGTTLIRIMNTKFRYISEHSGSTSTRAIDPRIARSLQRRFFDDFFDI